MSDSPIDGSRESTPVTAAQQALTPTKGKGYGQTWVTLFTELAFVAFPFVVIFIVLARHDKTSRILQMSELSFAGIILGGQGITKYVSGAFSKRKVGANSFPALTVLIATVSVFLLLFACFILHQILEIRETMEPAGQLSPGLIIWQIVILLSGTLMFILLGGSGELAQIRFEKDSNQGN